MKKYTIEQLRKSILDNHEFVDQLREAIIEHIEGDVNMEEIFDDKDYLGDEDSNDKCDNEFIFNEDHQGNKEEIEFMLEEIGEEKTIKALSAVLAFMYETSEYTNDDSDISVTVGDEKDTSYAITFS